MDRIVHFPYSLLTVVVGAEGQEHLTYLGLMVGLVVVMVLILLQLPVHRELRVRVSVGGEQLQRLSVVVVVVGVQVSLVSMVGRSVMVLIIQPPYTVVMVEMVYKFSVRFMPVVVVVG
jgi:hypothetical protein